MQRFRRMQALMVISIVTALGATALRADPGQPEVPPSAVAGGDALAAISFKGGTVAGYVAEVGKAFGGVNAAIAPGVESVRVGPVELVNVSANNAMIALSTLAASPVVVDWHGSTVLIDGMAATRRSSEHPSELRVWAMGRVLAEVKAEDALAAMQLATDMVGPGAELMFHADTQLLLVKGTKEQLSAVHSAFDRLEENVRQNSAAGNAETELQSARHRIAELEAQLEEARRTIEVLTKQGAIAR